ncbi:hypothetical protein [Glycomyces buryatensis]|uniref:Uncharacterized protein n=1 Tax=Glycomyces buryatensis TaxID=2570927 RepID=A0A4S8Q1H3_9ACTN|nr:hypothetical protein [Glycomyces buryatensis]THV34389.1 hypothetical protein FAB82_24355 [Glycomyces buryatensis]
MTDNQGNTPDSDRPEWLKEVLQKAAEEEPPNGLDMSRAWRYTQPLGRDDEGNPQVPLTPEEMQRIKDIREGRVVIEGPVDLDF